MTDIYLLIQALISGLVCGLILFQSIFVAPVVFRELPEESRPIILRSLFPKLFKSIAIGGFLFTLSAFLAGSDIFLPYIIGIFTFLSGLICNLMVNPTNRARDESEVGKQTPEGVEPRLAGHVARPGVGGDRARSQRNTCR